MRMWLGVVGGRLRLILTAVGWAVLCLCGVDASGVAATPMSWHEDGPYLGSSLGVAVQSRGSGGPSWLLEGGFRRGHLRVGLAASLQWADYDEAASNRHAQTEAELFALAGGVDVDISPSLFGSGRSWRWLPFVGLGVGARWRLIEETVYSYTGYEDGRRVARRGLERHGMGLADAVAGTFGQLRIGVGIPLLKGGRGTVDLVPQVRQTFGPVRTTHLEVGLRWWF